MTFLKVILLIVVIICVLFFILGLKSQKGSAPGMSGDVLAECGSAPNCVCSETGGQPERSVAALQGSMDEAKAAIIDMGGVITSESSDYISATFMSSLFKFVDDVELRPGAAGEVHIRSASRVGYSDRGVNRKRVDAIRAKMSAKN